MKCINECKNDHLFEVIFQDSEKEIHCADCLSVLMKEDPEQIISLKRIDNLNISEESEIEKLQKHILRLEARAYFHQMTAQYEEFKLKYSNSLRAYGEKSPETIDYKNARTHSEKVVRDLKRNLVKQGIDIDDIPNLMFK